MEFITQGNRIAVENFDKGKLYTVLWKNDTQENLMCISIGADCVVFQGEAPINLFTLSMRNADSIDSIEPTQLGTTNYNNLINKPQINGVDLIGNKTGAQLGLASQSDLEDYATNASVVAGLATKQDALSSSQLSAVNSGITSALVTQIGTNENNISTANAEIVKLVDSGAKNVLEMYSYEVGSMNADVDNSKTYRVRVHGTGQNVAITYGKLKSFESGNYVVKINIVSGTLTSLYLNDGTDNISITDATSGKNITLDSSKTYQLRTYAGNGATIDFTVDIMVCSKSAWDISQKITEYLPTYAEIAKPIDGDITWNTTALGSEPNINSKYIMQQGNIVNIQLYIEFTTALTENAETIIGVLTGVAFPKSIYRGVAMQGADYYSSALTSCYIAIGTTGNVVIKPPTGATNKRYLINITYHNH